MNVQVRNCATGILAFAAASAAFPVCAFAEESAGVDAILPQMEEFIPMLVAFIILWIVLAKFGWPLFAGMLEKREKTIKSSLEKAEEARQESERILAENQKKLDEANAKAQEIVTNARLAGEKLQHDITAHAKAEAKEMVEKAKQTIEAEKVNAIKELQGSMADTSIAVASRIVGEDFSDEQHRALIERYVKEAGSLNG